jgi:Carboxypeptidase regulatory-like domain
MLIDFQEIRRTATPLLLAFLFFFFPVTAVVQAQTASGSISGQITDPTGAVLPGAAVQLTNVQTDILLHTTTSDSGSYEFLSVAAGSYRLTVTRDGFTKTERTFDLAIQQAGKLDMQLSISGSTQTVDVQAAQIGMDTETSSLGQVVSARDLVSLPVSGRNPLALAGLAPGVATFVSFGTGIVNVRGAVQAAGDNDFSTNGGLAGSNEILMDGFPITVCCQGEPVFTPSQEIVAQFKVQASVPPAQFGYTSGGILNTITKSGANAYHGSVYEFDQNTIFNAANYFQKHSAPPIPGHNDYRLPKHYNQFGATFGGPVSIPKLYHGRDRTFFFFGFEGAESRRGQTSTFTVPTLLERQGNFSEGPSDIYNPYTLTSTGAGTYQRTAFANNIIPQGMLNSTALFTLSFFPLPNTTGTVNNVTTATVAQDSDYQYSLRLDHTISQKDQLLLRLTKDDNVHHDPDLLGTYTGPNAYVQSLSGYIFNVGNTYTLSPNILFDIRYGFLDQGNHRNSGLVNVDPLKAGFSPTFVSQMQAPGLPQFQVSGLPTLGDTNFFRYSRYTHFLAASVLLQRGKHTITAGWDGRMIFDNDSTLSNGSGIFTYDSTFTKGPNPNAAAASGQSTFDSIAAFLLGTPTSGSIVQLIGQSFYQRYSGLYVQDDWKVTPKLTLNLGLRYEYQGGVSERHNKLATFDPSGTNPLSAQTGLNFTGATDFASIAGNHTSFWHPVNSFAPRVGFAFQAVPNLVFRGAYGILFIPYEERIYTSANPGNGISTNYTSTINGFIPANTVTNPFPEGILYPTVTGPTYAAGTNTSGTIYSTPVSYTEQYNFGFENTWPKSFVFSLNYAGSHGVHLPVSFSPNDLDPSFYQYAGSAPEVAYLQQSVANPFAGHIATGTLAVPTVQRVQLLRQFPQYTGITEQNIAIGEAGYNSLQANLTKRVNHGLTTIISYTWSKLLTNVNNLTTGGLDIGLPGYQNSHLLNLERAVSPSDTTNMFIGSAIWDLPFGRGQQFFNDAHGFVQQVIGGWQLSSIYTAHSGYPLAFSNSGAPAFAGSRPNFTGLSPVTRGGIHSRVAHGYLNAAGFAYPLALQLGNVPRLTSNIRTPAYYDLDLSASKDIRLYRETILQFRIDSFNAFNQVIFSGPSASSGAQGFGTITSQSNNPRQFQLSGKFIF